MVIVCYPLSQGCAVRGRRESWGSTRIPGRYARKSEAGLQGDPDGSEDDEAEA